MEIQNLLTNNHKYDKLSSDACVGADSFVVTDIRPALRDDSRVNIYICGEYSFSLDISQVIDLKVKIKNVYSEKELNDLKSASEFGKLYSSTLEWVLTRPHSEKEIRDYLKKRQQSRTLNNRRREQDRKYKEEHASDNPYKNPDKLDENGRLKFTNSPWARKTEPLPEISTTNIEKVLARLAERGFIDDEKFAKFYIENRFEKKGISERRLREELSKKGVEKSIIDVCLESSSRDPREEIKKVINKNSRYTDDKLKAYLLRQGFPYDLISEMLD